MLANTEGMVVIVIYTGWLIDPYLCVTRYTAHLAEFERRRPRDPERVLPAVEAGVGIWEQMSQLWL